MIFKTFDNIINKFPIFFPISIYFIHYWGEDPLVVLLGF